MINATFDHLQAQSVRSVGMRDARDEEIFMAARAAGAIIMSKDSDFLDLIEKHGTPPKIIWITSGNTSNSRMRLLLERTLSTAVALLNAGESLVEIGDSYT